MNGSRFDAWTRRQFGLATSGAVVALLDLRHVDAARQRKKKKRKNKRRKNRPCIPLRGGCQLGGTRKCCGDAICDAVGNNGTIQTFCCQQENLPCSTDGDCCDALACAPGGTCRRLAVSDRNLKTNFASVDPADILARVRDLPISTWNYTSDDASIRHLGPMAQDFAALFALGDDRHIHATDSQGVTLAAIQGLAMEVERLRAENLALAGRIAALEQTDVVP